MEAVLHVCYGYDFFRSGPSQLRNQFGHVLMFLITFAGSCRLVTFAREFTTILLFSSNSFLRLLFVAVTGIYYFKSVKYLSTRVFYTQKKERN